MVHKVLGGAKETEIAEETTIQGRTGQANRIKQANTMI